MMVSITSRSFSMENKVPFVFILDEMTTFKVRDFEKLPSVPVSYTHLDVYKRQPYFYADQAGTQSDFC